MVKASVSLGALALTGLSRIQAKRHTTTQVIAGGVLGFGLSYVFANKPENKQQVSIIPASKGVFIGVN